MPDVHADTVPETPRSIQQVWEGWILELALKCRL
jgi:hypothetical protein